MQRTSHAQLPGACVELLKCHAPFSVGVMEWKSAATYGQKKFSATEEDVNSDSDDVDLCDD